ncbi:MAG: hypothetical protein U5K99_09885 [Anaerolineales bacterium]|nr:hypothetical protein [Anaerolineales bacterium]
MPKNNFAYIRGNRPSIRYPLEDYYPGYREGVLKVWLERQPPPPGLLLDSFGSNPLLALEAARSGHRYLAAVNNPITRFLVKTLATPPQKDQLNAAVAALAGSFKGKERLEPHVLSLYETECPQCGSPISARAFIWSRKKSLPIRKICRCPDCGDQGEYQTTEDDVERALSYRDNSLYHARALTRVASPEDPIHPHVEKTLSIYPPRAVYALFTLINKYTALGVEETMKRHLAALLLNAFAHCHALLPADSKTPLLTELKPPGQYRENNVWYVFEEGVNSWPGEHTPVSVQNWPDLPPRDGGITLFPGRSRDLIKESISQPISLIVVAPPHPNPVFWSLSALWSGWLWGQESAAALRNILTLSDMDWTWYARAVEGNLSSLSGLVDVDTTWFGTLSGLNPSFLSATLTAAQSAGISLQGLALNSRPAQAQLSWRQAPHEDQPPRAITRKTKLLDAGYQLLKDAGEPCHTLTLYAAGLSALADSGLIPPGSKTPVDKIYQQISQELDETYAYRQGFLYYSEPDTWWHQELNPGVSPLSDQVEIELVQLLVGQDQSSLRKQLEDQLFAAFPGLLTPPADLISVCLESYAEPLDIGETKWTLKTGDQPENRVHDLKEIAGHLQKIGEELNFQTKQLPPIGQVLVYTWTAGGETQATFFISASALLNKIITRHTEQPPHPWIVLPGSRAKLVAHKLKHNPPLADLIADSWSFLKFRHLRRLAEEGSLTPENFPERFNLDPLTYDAPQLPLI